MRKITYKSSGVDVCEGNRFTDRIKPIAKRTSDAHVISSIGGFGGLYDISTLNIKDPVLVTSADGVGTKVKIAIEMKKYDTVGIDAVAMNVNDILTLGAKPLFFLDYLAVGRLNIDEAAKIVEGVARGCTISGCSLIGGETAEMPDVYSPGDFDLAGFCVGALERGKIIDGRGILEGDVLVGLHSSGFHSNGFSLVRKVILEAGLDIFKTYSGFKRPLGEELLEPTRIYVKDVLSLLGKVNIKGMAHITGGSFKDKVSRIIPDGLCAKIEKSAWRIPDIFRLIQESGGISDAQMYSTFNSGIGYVLVLDAEDCKEAMSIYGSGSVEIGRVIKDSRSKVMLV